MILFISDLHLCEERPEITELFLEFLKLRAGEAQALYILGDLFEVWIGDDSVSSENRRVITALNRFSGQGTRVMFMHGNRDFLIGEDFAQMSGCSLITDPTIIDLYGEPTLLMHGDTLCTDDLEYQQFRSRVRDPQVQREFLSQPAAKRSAIVDHYRQESRERSRHKAAEIMDVNQDAVIRTMKQYQVRRLIHGHTHRPAIHSLKIDGQDAERIVLGDWYHQGSMLTVDESGCHLEGFDRISLHGAHTG
jgi:UDP-2,3-diacylglucosamine hydrolase